MFHLMYLVLSDLQPFLIICWYFIFWVVSFEKISFQREYIWLIGIIITLALVYRPLNLIIFEEEKLATLMPFVNLNKIFSLCLSYFIFHDVSLLSLGISLLAVFVIIWFSIDFKYFTFPKNFGKILIVQLLTSIRFIAMWRCIIQLSDTVYYVIEWLMYWVILLLIILSRHNQNQITQFSKEFYANRLWASFLWAIWFIISLYLISELWTTIVILLGFLNVGLQIIVAYFYLDETPSKKDIILTALVLSLVALWFYFR